MAVEKPSMKEQNLQSALLFMQQDHAKTLKGLHEEINKLQNKCKDLTFQLAMETTSTSQEDYYRTKCDEKEEEVVRWRTKTKGLEERVTEKDALISQLQKRMKRMEYKHLEELKAKSVAMRRAEADLLSKSAELTTLQMSARTSTTKDSDYTSQDLMRRPSSGGGSSTHSSVDSPRSSLQSHGSASSSSHGRHRHRKLSYDSGAESSVASSSSAAAAGPLPHPPSGSSQQHHGRRHSGGGGAGGGRPLSLVINRPASGRKLLEEDAPDDEARAEILEITKSQRLQLSGSTASKILPPIPPSSSAAAPPKGPPRLHKANSAAFARRKTASTESKESVNVETLAIDQVNGGTRKINLRRAQEFNSQDGT